MVRAGGGAGGSADAARPGVNGVLASSAGGLSRRMPYAPTILSLSAAVERERKGVCVLVRDKLVRGAE